jgi:predicted lipoprotein with Yx(FWY)xxD motif
VIDGGRLARPPSFPSEGETVKAILFATLVLAAAIAGLGRAAAANNTSTTVSIATSKLGRILVDNRGRTLYLFEKDRRRRSACAGACAIDWPPLLTKVKPTAGQAAKQSLLGTTRRADGTTQVTYAGHPLYRYVQDMKPGQTTGQDLQDFGAGWYVLAPSGAKIESGS